MFLPRLLLFSSFTSVVILTNNVDNKINMHPKVLAFNRDSVNRPTKCQVCRVLTQEITLVLEKTKNKKLKIKYSNQLDGNKKNDLSYKTSDLRILEVLEDVCNNVEFYRAIAGPEFPYLRNVRSMYRHQLDVAMKEGKVPLKFDAAPFSADDPTSEIKRMHFECIQMVEEYEEEIVDWFKKSQHIEALQYICNEHVLNKKNNVCLRASTKIPDWGIKTSIVDEDEPIYNFRKKSRDEL